MKKGIVVLCVAFIALAAGCQTECQDCGQTDGMLSSQSLALFGEVGGEPWGDSSAQSFKASSSKAGQRFGQALAITDITGEGKLDIVTAHGTEGGLNTHGRVRIYIPNSTSLVEVDFTKNDPKVTDSYGWALAAGHFCPDLGANVVIASAPTYNNIKGGFGIIYKKGNKYQTQVRLQQPATTAAYPMAGTQLTVDDVNGDGKADLVFQSMPMDKDYNYLAPKVSVLLDVCHQVSGQNYAVSAEIEADSANSEFGSALYVADLDGKGQKEIIVVDKLYSAPGNNVSPNGAIYFYKYDDGKLVKSRDAIIGEQTANYGASIESVAFSDIDGDGDLDLIVGEPMVQTNGKREGRVRTYTNNGAANVFDATDIKWSAVGGSSNMYFGSSLAVADVNHDGISDLVVGAPGRRANETGNERAQGRVMVYMGTKDGSVFSKKPFWTYVSNVSTSLNDDFGRSLAVADIDSKGWLDLVVGAPGASTSASSLDEGRVDVFMQSDGHCYTANGCFVQEDNQCYMASETASNNKCLVCDPSQNNFGLVALTCSGEADKCHEAAACDPTAGCQITNKPDGTSCGDDVCYASNTYARYTCQSGSCVEEQTQCGNYLCFVPNANGCPTSCTTDTDCTHDTICVNGACIEKVNTPPVIVVSPSVVETYPGGTFSIEGGDSYDPDGDALNFHWSCTGDLAIDNETSPLLGVSVSDKQAVGTTETCTLTLSDSQGASEKASVTVHIQEKPENELPIIIINTLTEVHLDDIVTIDASMSHDPEGTQLSFVWYAPKGIELSDYQNRITSFKVPAGIGNTFDILLEVTDADGYKNSTSVTYHIVNQGDYFITLASPKNNESVENPVTFAGSASSESIVVVQNLDANIELCRTTSDSAGNWSCKATLEPNVYYVQAYVVDESYQKLAFTDEVQIQVLPNTQDIVPEIISPKTGDTISLRPTISGRIDNDAKGNIHVWYATQNAQSTLLCTAEIKTDGSWACTAGYDLTPATAYTFQANLENTSGNYGQMSDPVVVTTQDSETANITVLSPSEGAQLPANYAVIIAGSGPAGGAVDVYKKMSSGEDSHLCSAFVSEDGYWACYNLIFDIGEYTIYASDASIEAIVPSNTVHFSIVAPRQEPVFEYEDTRGGSCSMTTAPSSNFGWLLFIAGFAGLALIRRRQTNV